MLNVPEIEISFQPKLKTSQLPVVVSSKQAYNLLAQRWDKGNLQLVEECKILLLNKNNRVLGIYYVAKGGMDKICVDPKVIFIVALKACATALILAHNHPSGNLKPSNDDIHLTQKLIKAGQLLDIIVLDHLILTSDGYISMNEEGYL